MEEKANSTMKAVSFMMVITLLGKVMGLFRDQLMAANYAIGMEAEAFLTASRVPRLFFDAVFASAISASFIPVFNEYMQKKGKEEAFQLSNRFITLILLVTTLMTVLGIVFAEQLVWLSADGLQPKTAALCTVFLKRLFPAVIFTGLAFSFVGILQSLDEFGIPAAMSVASNFVIIVYFLFFNQRFGLTGLTAAFLIGWMMQAVIQIPALLKKGYRFRPCLQLRDEGMQKIGRLMLPVMVSTWIQPINVFINTKIASHLFDGAVAVAEYANTLYSIITGVFVLSIANVIFPKLSRMVSPGEEESFGQTVGNTIKSMMFLLLPMMAGLGALSQPIVRLIYEWGGFDSYATMKTAQALFFYSFGMVWFGIQTVLSRAFYAMQDGKTPFYSSVVSIFVNLGFCLLLVGSMDIGGLALAASIASMVSALLLWASMRRKYPGMVSSVFKRDVLKMILATLIMLAVVLFAKEYLLMVCGKGLIGRVLVVGCSAMVGVVCYMAAAYILKISECQVAIGLVNRFIKR